MKFYYLIQNNIFKLNIILHVNYNHKNQSIKKLMQLKPTNRQKQKKLKPIKQPVKSLRPQRQIYSSHRTEETHHIPNSNNLKNDKENRSKQVLAHSIPLDQNNHKVHNKEMICMDLLQQGNVQSFIDFFYISHKCLPNVMQKKNYFGESIHIPETTNNEQEMQFLTDFSQALTKAEIRPESTKDQKQLAMNEYNSIAFNYEDQGDFGTASYFYQRVVELAISCKNKQYELIALLGLGKCYDQTSKKNEAIELLEDAFDMACVLEDKGKRVEMTKLIGKELIEIYIKKAEETLKFDVGSALESYESGLKVAQRSKETESEARISHKIGELYYIEGRYQRSIQFQEQYLNKLHQVIAAEINRQTQESIQKKENSSQSSLKFKQMQAHASLAKCYLKLKNIQKSQQHLNEYNRMAKQSKAQNYVADSSYYLAKLFQQKNQSEKAIQFYQAYFQAAKSQKQDKKDRKLVDKARVTYAIAKSNRNMEKYIEMFATNDNESLRKILDWKIKRVMK